MKYVLDASVAVKWVLPESDSAIAIDFRDNVEAGNFEIIAPDTFPIEVAHALTRAERRGLLPVGKASDGLDAILANELELFPYMDFLSLAVELSSKNRIGVYDCLYVALAEEMDCELITADARLVNAFHGLSRIVLLSDL